MIGLDFPTASVTAYASPYGSLPVGWVKCNGDTYDGSLDRYKILYEQVGNTYGGSGTTFKVPNLGQRIVVAGTRGEWYGKEKIALDIHQSGIGNHTHTFTELPHTHGITDAGHSHTVYYQQFPRVEKSPEATAEFYEGYAAYSDRMAKAYSGLNGGTTGDSDGGGSDSIYGPYAGTTWSTATSAGAPHENRMPFLVMQYIIKL
jgi:microcystin-dependent protein